MHLDALFSQFIREKQFLGNISPRTVKSIKDLQRAYKRTLGDMLPAKDNLKEFVIKLQVISATRLGPLPQFHLAHLKLPINACASFQLFV